MGGVSNVGGVGGASLGHKNDGHRFEAVGIAASIRQGSLARSDGAGAESAMGGDRRGQARGEAARMGVGKVGGEREQDDAIQTRANEMGGEGECEETSERCECEGRR